MALIMGQATVPVSGTVPLFNVPASWCAVTFYNLNTAATVYVGTSTAVSNLNGLQCHSIPTSFTTFTGSKGGMLYGTQIGGPSSSATVLNFIISTDF